jgi:hypothetical protein
MQFNSAREYCKALKALMKDNPNGVKFYEFLLENGKEFQCQPVPKTLPKGIRSKTYQVKQCFYNAQTIALLHGYDYYEGFAISLLPVEHAWVISRDGELLDLTWDKVAENGEKFDYFGVHIPSNFVRIHMLKTNSCVGLLMQWWKENEKCEKAS